jgi:PmbA protein
MMDSSDLDTLAGKLGQFADRALQMARDRGAEARVCATASLETRLAGNGCQPSLANRVENATLEILVSKDHRTGSASVNGFDERSLRNAVAFALSLARFSLPNPGPTLAARELAPAASTLGFQFDPALCSMTFDEFQEITGEAAACMARDRRILLERYDGEMSVTWRTVRNSLGVHQTERRTFSSWSFLGMAHDGEEVTGSDYEANFSFRRDGLGRSCIAGATALRQRLIEALNAHKPPSYNGPILLAPRAVHDLVIGPIVYHASGRAVMDATSRWANSIGEKVANVSCSLAEKPHDGRFSGATAFDGDGVPTAVTTILEQGLLVSYLHDVVSAGHLSQRTTGHANRALCLEMAAGPSPLRDMTAASPRLLMVHRFAGNADPISGHYSGIAKSSRLYLNGQDAGSVTETMIAGDLSDPVGQILGVSHESENVCGECEAPYVLVNGACVTGG